MDIFYLNYNLKFSLSRDVIFSESIFFLSNILIMHHLLLIIHIITLLLQLIYLTFLTFMIPTIISHQICILTIHPIFIHQIHHLLNIPYKMSIHQIYTNNHTTSHSNSRHSHSNHSLSVIHCI